MNHHLTPLTPPNPTRPRASPVRRRGGDDPYAGLHGQCSVLQPNLLHELRLRLGQRTLPLPGRWLHRRVSQCTGSVLYVHIIPYIRYVGYRFLVEKLLVGGNDDTVCTYHISYIRWYHFLSRRETISQRK